MEPWAVFLLLAGICFVIGVISLALKSQVAASNSPATNSVHSYESALTMSQSSSVPEVWDERSISRHLDELRGQSPAVISHYVESVKTRWVLGQNDKTAIVRARFLKTKVEELKLMKEGQQLMVDLEALALEREKRLKTLQLENAQLDDQMRTRSDHEQLVARKEQRQLELEIAQIEKQIRDLNAPSTSREPELSPEQRRAQDKKKCEARIAELKAQKKDALKIDDEEERILKVNAIDHALEQEYERWGKLL